jgi:hypothetical protein
MCVGNAQKRLGEAHHGDAFVAAEIVGLQESIEARRLVSANALYQGAGGSVRLSQRGGIQARLIDPLADDSFFVRAVREP